MGKYPGLSITMLVVYLAALFYLMATTADVYFCPALTVLSDFFRLSPNVAGVTLLALGNGAADLFSAFAGLQGGNFGVLAGDLLGGSLFVTSAVVASITFAAQGKLTRRPFLRYICCFGIQF